MATGETKELVPAVVGVGAAVQAVMAARERNPPALSRALQCAGAQHARGETC